MKDMGYECDLQTMAMSGKTRHIYYAGPVPMIDVFFDKLDYCHEVNYKDRLELDPYCVPLADIVLQKLQIVEINDKDLKDIEYLFITCEIGDDDTHKINQNYIAKRFADDWGFWYTATQLNLERVKKHCDTVPALTPEMRGARQGAGRQAACAGRRRAQDQGLEQARQEGCVEDLVQRRLLRLVSRRCLHLESASQAGRLRHP